MQKNSAPIPLHLIQKRRLKRFYIGLTAFFVIVQILWVGIPILMAVMWSLVNPKDSWSYPNLFPPSFSLEQWRFVFRYTNIGRALRTSYTVAPLAVILSFLLSLPTSYILGRKNVPGKKVFMLVVLLPMIMPGMVVALFLSRVFAMLGLSQTFFGLVVAHTLMSMPYMIRVMTTSFASIPQDVIDAAENLGATTYVKIKDIFLPMIRPGLLAGMTFETIPTILYSFMGYNFIRTNAAVVSLLMMTPNIIMLFIVERFLKSDYLSASLGKM